MKIPHSTPIKAMTVKMLSFGNFGINAPLSNSRMLGFVKIAVVRKAKLMGASMVKLLVYYHPDAPTAHEIEKFVRSVSDECKRYDLCRAVRPD